MAVFIQNKKIRLEYELLKTFEAGLELFGFEVKSLRAKHGSLEGGYIIIRGGEAYLIGINIPPFQVANTPKDYDPKRNRKLLLTKKELNEFENSEKQRGLTIVPISVYNKGRKLKLECAVVRGKKKRDKRETLKKRDAKRDMERAMKSKVR